MSRDVADRLREHPFSQGFCPEHIARMAAMASEVGCPAGTTIFRDGDSSSLFYLLVTGSVALEAGPPGQPVRVATLFAGDVLGWSSVTGGAGQRFEARALEDVRALALGGARLRNACENDFSFGFRFARAVVATMTGRVCAIRAQLPDIETPVGNGK